VEFRTEAPKPPNSTRCAIGSIRDLVDKFLLGEDLDKDQRRQIYAQWKHIHCYVLPSALNVHAKKVSPFEQSRAIRLLLNAIINNSELDGDLSYWQPSGSNRRDFSRLLPFVLDSDIRVIFNLIPLDDDQVRSEAFRFVKTLPVDSLEKLFRERLSRMNQYQPREREKFAIAASYLYYNRVVEWLDVKPDVDRSAIRKAITIELEGAANWTHDKMFDGKSAKPYEAMLLYAKGIVERELPLTDDSGKASFNSMLRAVWTTDETYPSRFLHIGQALAVVEGDKLSRDILRHIQSAVPYPPATLLDANPAFAGSFSMYAGPDRKYPTLKTKVGTKEGARLLLRLGDWHLVSARKKVGWINRPASL
jgi:hypothetical protein